MSPRPAARLPLGTLGLVGISVLLLALPQLAEKLAFERAELARAPWRLLSGHLVHARAVAAADLLVLALFAAWWEQRARRTFAWILLASGALASLALVCCTDFARYSGSSALSSGLFVAAGLTLAREERGAMRWAGALGVLLFAAKCALELAGFDALFVILPAGMRVAAVAHVAGGVGGALVVAWGWRRGRGRTPGATSPARPG